MKGLGGDAYKDTYAHELIHFEYYSENWKIAANVLNGLEEEYCAWCLEHKETGRKRANATLAYGNAAVAYYYYFQLLQSAMFDVREYGMSNGDRGVLQKEKELSAKVSTLRKEMEEKKKIFDDI